MSWSLFQLSGFLVLTICKGVTAGNTASKARREIMLIAMIALLFAVAQHMYLQLNLTGFV
jgi:hypothetical protein